LVENALRDVQIAFANELSIICDEAEIDVNSWFIVSKFKEKAKIIRTAREINNYKTEWVIEKIKNESTPKTDNFHKKSYFG